MHPRPSELFSDQVSGNQVVMDDFLFLGSLKHSKAAVWSNSLIIPAYIAVASAIILLLHIILLSKPVRKLYARLVPSATASSDVDGPVIHPVGFSAEVKAHITQHGGRTIFAFRVARFIGCLALLGLSITSLVFDEIRKSEKGGIGVLGKWGRRHRNRYPRSSALTADEWLQAAMCMTYLYASLLALVSISAKPRWSRLVTRHLAFLLVVAFGVYVYRDIFPLTTFTKTPKDLSEGSILWAKFAVLTLVSVIIPLAAPRQYIPVDPKHPAAQPSPEQTAPLLSLLLYTFLDPVVFLAYRIPHLSHDQLPPLADYDYAKNLKERSFPHIDTFAGSSKRHIFFGLLSIFRWEYMTLGVMIMIQVVSGFASPLGINRLLHYLETRGEGAVIRPWLWIIWLFIGPTIGSIAFQWYIYIATRTLVRAECIITQLVFEHALRIRVKAETPSSSSTPSPSTTGTGTTTPDEASITEQTHQEASPSGSGDETTVRSSLAGSGDETLQSSSASIKSSSSKGKSKAKAATPAEGEAGDPKEAKADNLVGKINNLITTDLGNITDARDFLLVLVYIPLQITLCIVFLYAVLGWSAFVGLATMLILSPLPGFVAKQMQRVQKQRMQRTDARVQTVTETMNVLRMIKLFGWEGKMNKKVAEKRDDELKWLWKRQILDLVNGNLNFLIPVATMIATYSTYKYYVLFDFKPRTAVDIFDTASVNPFYVSLGYRFDSNIPQTVLMKEELSASKVFSSMSVFDMLREQLHMIFYSLGASVQGKVSLDRVNDFLHNTELLDSFSEKKDAVDMFSGESQAAQEGVIGFCDATFSWSSETDGSLTPSRRKFMLRIDDELTFKQGCINLIIGPTGSGKTSLLMALLGEMHFIPSGPNSWFNLPRGPGIAYAAQESWVQNETIRENIVFGAPFDEERYNKVIHQCCLERDLTLFEAGDKTEVGEKGLTLSGGQKARITLARAIYSRAEIILLDDVLAALDVHTAKWIIDECFTGDLIKGRTVLLVTHNVAMARPIADFVVALGIDGRVVSKGSVSDAIAKDRKLAREVNKDQNILDKVEDQVDVPLPGDDPKPDGKLIVAEEIELGHVSWPALKLYLAGLGGSHPFLFFLAFIGGMFICEFSNVLQTWFLGHWASQYDSHPASEVSVSYYLTIYGSLLLFAVIVYCLSYLVFVFGNLRASRSIHKQLVESVLGTTLRWLDTTPTSRVIARCTQDIRAVDGPISQGLGWLSELTTSMIIKFGAVVVLTPMFLGPGLLVAVLGGWCGQIYIAAQLSVKREMSNARAPVLGHFGAAIAGLTSIRAYGVQQSFKEESLNRIDRYTRAARTFYNLNRWICVRIDALGGLFAAGLAGYLVYFQAQTASNTGFSLNMAVGFSGMILWWVRILNDFEVQGNSLERIQGYVRIEQEPKPTNDGIPPAYWPASGEIRVENLSARYSQAGPKVLHDVSFHIKSGERVGVVGRTGSGKSSLTLSLLRCIFTEGTVYYDGIPTTSVNLDALRSNITIIPQVPELLSGTLRQNLDPFSQYDDATLNDALRAAGLFSLQTEDDDGRITLDSPISSGGGNLSVGQRQILALARAIVRGSKLLILDEATSAIDYKTDSVIQSSLRNELSGDVTLITVAHRLQTIMDADKIMVLDAGRIVEFDSPKELLRNEHGKLRALVDESGDRDALFAMAEGR